MEAAREPRSLAACVMQGLENGTTKDVYQYAPVDPQRTSVMGGAMLGYPPGPFPFMKLVFTQTGTDAVSVESRRRDIPWRVAEQALKASKKTILTCAHLTGHEPRAHDVEQLDYR